VRNIHSSNRKILHTMRQRSPSYGGIWCALFIIVLTLIPSPLPGEVVVEGVAPEKSLQTSKELFSLSGKGFDTGDTIILVGSPPRTRWQIPAFDPAGEGIGAIRVRGSRAYVVEDSKTLHILNIENPEQPKLLGTLSDARFGNITKIWPTDRYLYMSDLNYGIWVADIADPAHPFLVGNGGPNYSFYMPTTTGLYVRGTTIFSTNWQTGLQIIEQIANGQIRSRGSIPISGTPSDIFVNGSLAYVAIDYAVQIFNVGNPDNPTYISQMTQIPGEEPKVHKLTIKDDMLYMVDLDYGIHIAELVNPAAPQIIASLSLVGQTKDIHITGTFAITANGENGLQIITLTRRENPQIFGNIYTHGDATAIAPYPGYLYVANGSDGLGIIETPSLAHPAFLASFPTGDNPWAIACKEGFAYLSNSRSGLRVIQTAQPRLPRIVSTIPATQSANFSSVSGNTLYMADSTRFRTYDISDPSKPLLLGSLAMNDIIESFLIQGNYAYLANFTFGVQSVDISKPKTPLLKGSAFSPSILGLASDIDLDQGIAYVANVSAGLWIVDFHNPLFPFTISTLEQFTAASNIKKSQHRIYMTNGSSGVEVIDVSVPADPIPIVTMNYNNELLNGIDIEYPFLYTAVDYQGVWINYLSPDGEIIPIAPINLPGGALAVKSFGEFLYCGDGGNYFSIFSTPVVAEILSVSPVLLRFQLNRDLSPGDYDIFLIKKSGNLYSLLRGLSVYQGTVTFVPGLNIMGYPGYVPPENTQAFPLLANLAEQGEGGTLAIKKIMALINTGASSGSFLRAYLNQSNQPAGDNFDIHPLRGYPLYAMGTQEQGYLLAHHPLAVTQEELKAILEDEISPGRTLIALPAMEGGGIAVESLFRPDAEDSVSSIHEWDPVKGTWNATCLFFGRVNGKVRELKAGRGYLVCAH